MTTSTMARPSRKLDEFEELVYMYAARMGPHDDSQEVSSQSDTLICRPKSRETNASKHQTKY